MSTKAATAAPSVEAPAMPPLLEALLTSAARIRRLAARELKRPGIELWPESLREALTLLKHLRPTHVEAAIFCHRELVRHTVGMLRELGTTDDFWCDLANEVFDFLQIHGWRHSDGRWLTAAEEETEFQARRERPAIVS